MFAIDRSSLVAVALVLGTTAALPGATFTIVNGDAAGEGFNDPAARSPVTGNAGTTLGQQRLNLFNAAAAIWGAELKSNVAIRVFSKFDDLTCTDVGAVLGSAGPLGLMADFTNAPAAGTWFHIALANSLAGSDQSGDDDIQATFNSLLDDANPGCIGGQTFWYGIGAPAPAGTVDLFPVVLHELGHGLGFSTLYNKSTGTLCCPDPAPKLPDTFLRFLRNESTGENFDTMTAGERLTAQVNSGNLTWTGANANSVLPGFSGGSATASHLRMYAPNPVKQGSSVSHWDDVLSPDEFMEWLATPSPEDYATYFLMKDIGWVLQKIFSDGFESADWDFWSGHP